MRPQFSISLMCADYLALEAQLSILNRRGDAYHVDIMDGHFCPNFAWTPALMQAIRPVATLPMEAHLMTTRPGDWLEPVAQAGASVISLHLETIERDAFRQMRRVQALGCAPGLALCPATPFSQAHCLLEEVQVLTLMTVDVGFAGQPFIPAMLKKLEQARDFKRRHGLGYLIQVDGACNKAHFAAMRGAGAERFILGSGLFGKAMGLDAAFDAVLQEYKIATGEEIA